jgi:plastocyanin
MQCWNFVSQSQCEAAGCGWQDSYGFGWCDFAPVTTSGPSMTCSEYANQLSCPTDRCQWTTSSASTTPFVSTTRQPSTTAGITRASTTSSQASGQTHVVSWGLDVSQASIAIDVGDTVEWTWDQGGVHDLVAGLRTAPDTTMFASQLYASPTCLVNGYGWWCFSFLFVCRALLKWILRH